MTSRALRSTELRITEVELDDAARNFIATDPDQVIRLIAHRPGLDSIEEYDRKDYQVRCAHNITPDEYVIFLEIGRSDTSAFDARLCVRGVMVGPHRVLRATSPSIPNAIAALLIHLADVTGKLPHAYFGWTEGNPVGYIFRFLFLGEGDVAPVTREVLRKNIADPQRRPFIHVT